MLGKAGARVTVVRLGSATVDADIERRTCFVIDLDPVRDAETSATDDQLAEARALATTIVKTLHAEGWPKPTEVCSGNGMHLYHRLDIEGRSDLPRRALRGLDERFSTPGVKVDTTVGNPSRIMRIPGTWTAKDDQHQLHGTAAVEAAGEDRLLTPKQLEAVAPAAPSQHPAASQVSPYSGSFDVDAWLQTHGVRHRGREPWPGGGAGTDRTVERRDLQRGSGSFGHPDDTCPSSNPTLA